MEDTVRGRHGYRVTQIVEEEFKKEVAFVITLFLSLGPNTALF